MCRTLVLVLAAGCGRIGFDAQSSPGGDAAPPDGASFVECESGTVVGSSIEITGTTFRYMSFDNQTVPVEAVSVQAYDGSGAPQQTTSDATGAYQLSLQTNGGPLGTPIAYVRTGYFSTIVHLDQPLRSAVTGGGVPLWSVGDGPLWSQGSMDSVYTTAGEDYDPALGTLNVAVRDCAGNAIDGVSVTIDPPSGVVTYTRADGTPDPDLTSTMLPFATMVALGVTAGSTRITATKPGLVFADVVAEVSAGSFNTLAILRAGQ